MPVDIDAISKSLRRFVRSHNAEFQKLTGRQSQLLEVGAFLSVAKHYEWIGYEVRLHNPQRSQIRVKLGTRGHPWNFSRFEVYGDGRRFEIHTNLPVIDAAGTPGARYVVDVAVVKSNQIPTSAPARRQPGFETLDNGDLITFLEAKSLVIYPMLIAQFIGIVHELRPAFLNEPPTDEFIESGHFYPSLVSLGYLHGTCRNIVRGFPARQIHIGIVAQFDQAISRLGSGQSGTPLQSGPTVNPEEVIFF